MNPLDLILIYAAIGVSLAVIVALRFLLSASSVYGLAADLKDSDLPMGFVALIATLALAFIMIEFALLWPLRWRAVIG